LPANAGAFTSVLLIAFLAAASARSFGMTVPATTRFFAIAVPVFVGGSMIATNLPLSL